MSLRGLLRGDTVTVASYQGDSAYGATYAAPVIVDCRVQHGRKLVRSATGDEVVSESTIYVLPTLPGGARTADVFAPESLVTFETRQAQVIGVMPHRGRGPTVYVEITTT
jgi:hypothetical protein